MRRPHKVWSVHVPFPDPRDHQMLVPNCASPEAARWRSVEFIFRLSEIDHGGSALKRMNPNR